MMLYAYHEVFRGQVLEADEAHGLHATGAALHGRAVSMAAAATTKEIEQPCSLGRVWAASSWPP